MHIRRTVTIAGSRAGLTIGLLVLIWTAGFAQGGQEREGVRVGDRVRVEVADRQDALVGSLLGVGDDSLRVAGHRDTVSVPLVSVEKLEVSRGQRSRALEGLAGGAALGGLFVNLLVVECGGDPGACAFGRVVGTSLGAAVGGVVGLMFGAGSHTDRWEEVPVADLRLAGGIGGDGFAAFVQIRL